MPSHLARACSWSLQKGIDGSAFRGMIDVARAAAAAARRTAVGAAAAEEEPETAAEEEAAAAEEERQRPAPGAEAEAAAGAAAEEAGFLHSLCNFVANWRRRVAPRRRIAMVKEEELVDVLWEAQVVFQKKDLYSNWFEKSWQKETALFSVVSTGSRRIALYG